MAIIPKNKFSTEIPQEQVVNKEGYLTFVWSSFFRLLSDLLDYIRPEIVVQLTNNQSTWKDIPEVAFDSSKHTAYIIEFFAQRVYTTDKSFDIGTVNVAYLFNGVGWSGTQYRSYKPFLVTVPSTPIVVDPDPYITKVLFNVTAAGKLQYQTTNHAGTKQLDRVIFRIRPIAGKTTLYSGLS